MRSPPPRKIEARRSRRGQACIGFHPSKPPKPNDDGDRSEWPRRAHRVEGGDSVFAIVSSPRSSCGARLRQGRSRSPCRGRATRSRRPAALLRRTPTTAPIAPSFRIDGIASNSSPAPPPSTPVKRLLGGGDPPRGPEGLHHRRAPKVTVARAAAAAELPRGRNNPIGASAAADV